MREKGQGLVETALILPFLLILVVGLVELGVALQRQIVVVNAAREGARFGATGATPSDIHKTVLSAASEIFEFDEENATIVVIHATTNDIGNGFDEWEEHAYPEGAAAPHVTDDNVLEDLKKCWMLELEDGGFLEVCGDPRDVKFVIVDIEYDHQSILGLPVVGALADKIPIGSWTIMRLETPTVARPACLVYPIAVHQSTLEGREGQHVGDIYNGVGEGNFGWLRWPQDTSYASAVWLREFLLDPSWSGRAYQNADDIEDTELSIGDSVWSNTGLSNSGDNQAALDRLTTGRYIRVVVWDWADGSGNWAKYHVYSFAIVEITSYDLAGQNRISAKFIRWDAECGR